VNVLVDVVIPARDEADRIGSCVTSVVRAAERLRQTRPGDDARLTVVLDSCTDDTEVQVHRALRDTSLQFHVLSTAAGAVGVARGMGAHAALRVPAEQSRRWLANTDADSVVPEEWLVRHVEAFRHGADVLVAGVVPDPADLDDDVLERWRAVHTGDEALGHVHGANLGLSSDAYRSLGGFAELAEHEDVDLVSRARALGLVVSATLESPVVTSGRFVGRTPGGYAEHLRDSYATPTTTAGVR
jgi:glycosyltransferase involved in cell wall biosynthesis